MTPAPEAPAPLSPVDIERAKRRRNRNYAVFGFLLGFVLLVYGVTIIKIKLGYGP